MAKIQICEEFFDFVKEKLNDKEMQNRISALLKIYEWYSIDGYDEPLKCNSFMRDVCKQLEHILHQEYEWCVTCNYENGQYLIFTSKTCKGDKIIIDLDNDTEFYQCHLNYTDIDLIHNMAKMIRKTWKKHDVIEF